MEEQDNSALEELLEEIQAAIKDAVTLKITTIVGDVTKGDLASDPTVEDSKTMYTQIDLIQGDIVIMIDKAFLTDDFAAIREHHNEREEEAHEIIRKNIEALKELVVFVQELMAPTE